MGFFLCLKHVRYVPTWPAVPLAGMVFSRYSYGLFPHLCSNVAFCLRPSLTIQLKSETLPHYLNPALSIPVSCFIFSIAHSSVSTILYVLFILFTFSSKRNVSSISVESFICTAVSQEPRKMFGTQ